MNLSDTEVFTPVGKAGYLFALFSQVEHHPPSRFYRNGYALGVRVAVIGEVYDLLTVILGFYSDEAGRKLILVSFRLRRHEVADIDAVNFVN